MLSSPHTRMKKADTRPLQDSCSVFRVLQAMQRSGAYGLGLLVLPEAAENRAQGAWPSLPNSEH